MKTMLSLLGIDSIFSIPGYSEYSIYALGLLIVCCCQIREFYSKSYLHRLHLYNQSREQATDSSHVETNNDQPYYVDQFGFHVSTCCRAIPLDNTCMVIR